MLRRDLPDIAEIDKRPDLPTFVRLLAEHSGKLVNYSQLGAGIAVSHKTGQRYIDLLAQIFLIAVVQPWLTNALKRITRTPNLHFLDTGLLAAAHGLNFDRVQENRAS